MTRSGERRNDRWQVSPRAADGSRRRIGPHLGPLRITPVRLALAVALVGSGLFNLLAVVIVRDERQIPMLSAGFGVMGIVFAALALGGAIATFRAGSEGRSGRALLLAVAGGVAAVAAAGCFAASVILALVLEG